MNIQVTVIISVMSLTILLDLAFIYSIILVKQPL